MTVRIKRYSLWRGLRIPRGRLYMPNVVMTLDTKDAIMGALSSGGFGIFRYLDSQDT